MKRLVLVCLGCAAVAVWSVAVLADETPWAKPGAEKVKPENAADKAPAEKAPAVQKPAAEGNGLDLKKEMGPAYQRLIAPIVADMTQAEKVMDLYTKEMDKPQEKRNEKRANDHKLQAARFYLAANQKAKQAVTSVTKEDQKAAITAQFEKPAIEKAITLYLELADRAMKAKDYKTAESYYKRVLQLDADNAAAKDGLERCKQEAKAQAEAARKGGASGGKDDNERLADPSLKQAKDAAMTGREDTKKDWSKTGRESEGWKR